MDRVHDVVDRRRGRVHGGPSGGASLAQGMSGATGLQSSLVRAGMEDG
jgi:hypothetical protein